MQGAGSPKGEERRDPRLWPWVGLAVGALGAVGAWAIAPVAPTTPPPASFSALRIDAARRPVAGLQATQAVVRLNQRPASSSQLAAFLEDHRTRLVENGPKRFTGTAGPDLVAAMRHAGVPDSAIGDYVRAIGKRLTLAGGISVEDRFDLVLPYERRADGTSRFGTLQYAGLDRVGASDLQLVRWTIDGRGDWVDAQGLGSTVEGSMMPVSGAVSSGFGTRRHPILHRLRFHRGLDLRAAYGTPIRAASAGVVTMAGWAGGYGRQVRIAHGEYATSYAHMSRFAVSAGTRVARGQVIGFVGSSGRSTGPHLHFEVIRGGRAINPRWLKISSLAHVEPGEERAVRDHLRQVLASRSS